MNASSEHWAYLTCPPPLSLSQSSHVTEMPNTDHDYCVEPMTTEEQLVAAREEISRLSAENEALKSHQFGIQNFMSNSKLIQFYTGSLIMTL